MARGLRGRCPACGAGCLFRAYLKLSAQCPSCGAAFGAMETADVAPYLTIFVVGIFLTPLAFALTIGMGWRGDGVLIALLVGAVAMALLVLPRIKGMLAALLWRARREM